MENYHHLGFATSNIAAINGGNYLVALDGASYRGKLQAKHFETRGHLSPRMRFHGENAAMGRKSIAPRLSEATSRAPARSSAPPVCDGGGAEAAATAGPAPSGDAATAGVAAARAGSGAVAFASRSSEPALSAAARAHAASSSPSAWTAWTHLETLLWRDGADSFAFVYPLPRVLEERTAGEAAADDADDAKGGVAPESAPELAPGATAPAAEKDALDTALDALVLVGGFCVWDASGNLLHTHALQAAQPLAQPRAPTRAEGEHMLHINRAEDADEHEQPLLPQALRQYLYESHRVERVTLPPLQRQEIIGFCWVRPAETFDGFVSKKYAARHWPAGGFFYFYDQTDEPPEAAEGGAHDGEQEGACVGRGWVDWNALSCRPTGARKPRGVQRDLVCALILPSAYEPLAEPPAPPADEAPARRCACHPGRFLLALLCCVAVPLRALALGLVALLRRLGALCLYLKTGDAKRQEMETRAAARALLLRPLAQKLTVRVRGTPAPFRPPRGRAHESAHHGATARPRCVAGARGGHAPVERRARRHHVVPSA